MRGPGFGSVGRALAAVGLALVAALVLGAGPAHGHADLLLSTPEDGAQLEAAPDEVVLTFSEELLPDTVVVSVADDTGMVVRVLSFAVDGSDVIVTWPPGMSGSAYDVNYRVVSQDGHPIEGTVAFSVAGDPAAAGVGAEPSPAAAAPSGPAAAEPASDPTSLAPLAAISAGLGIGIAAGFLFWVMRRRGGRPVAGDPS